MSPISADPEWEPRTKTEQIPCTQVPPVVLDWEKQHIIGVFVIIIYVWQGASDSAFNMTELTQYFAHLWMKPNLHL